MIIWDDFILIGAILICGVIVQVFLMVFFSSLVNSWESVEYLKGWIMTRAMSRRNKPQYVAWIMCEYFRLLIINDWIIFYRRIMGKNLVYNEVIWRTKWSKGGWKISDIVKVRVMRHDP